MSKAKTYTKRPSNQLLDRYHSELKKAVLHLSNALDAISSEHPDWKELDGALDVIDSIAVDFDAPFLGDEITGIEEDDEVTGIK